MKKKALLASILTIALCFGAIAGSTYALFTDSKTVNIAVTSADLEVSAYLSDLKLWSAKDVNEYKGSATITKFQDEYDAWYYHAAQTTTFLNGGYAAIDSGTTLNITNITPGDKVGVNVNISNVGDVNFKYRYVVTVATDSALAKAMVFTNEAGDAFVGDHGNGTRTNVYYSEWSDIIVPNGTDITEMIYFELPIKVGNEAQADKTNATAFTITVEAVQGNAVDIEGAL